MAIGGNVGNGVGIALFVTPTSAVGLVETFNLQVSDSVGATDLVSAGLLLNSSASTVGACAVIYNRVQNTLALLTDGGGQPAVTLTPARHGPKQPMRFERRHFQRDRRGQPAYGKSVVYVSRDIHGNQERLCGGGQRLPIHRVDAGRHVDLAAYRNGKHHAFVRVGRATDLQRAGYRQLGRNRCNTLGLMINATSSTAGACAVIYNRAQNTLALLTDAGAQPAGTITPGSGSQSNSQCTLNGAVSSATVSGNALTVNAAITFLGTFGGRRTCISKPPPRFNRPHGPPRALGSRRLTSDHMRDANFGSGHAAGIQRTGRDSWARRIERWWDPDWLDTSTTPPVR